jgi:hypothetical protein
MSATFPLTAADDLRADLCGGALHRPGDPGYDAARTPWNLTVDQRPAAIAYPSSTAELGQVVDAARAAGLRIAAQGTGHAASALPDLSDAVLIRTSAMTGVTVDTERRTVRVQAGTLWDDAVRVASEHGITVLHGSSPDVGVVGYSLGGGLGWYARKLGLQAHHIVAATVVTSSGEIVEANDETHPDLMWAIRGGGGNFAVIAELEFSGYDFQTAYAGMLVWDWTRTDVVRAWAEWSKDAPDEVTTSLRYLQLPPIEDIPEPFRGRNFIVIDGAVLEDEDCNAEKVLQPLRDLSPEMDTFARVPTASLTRLHMDPEGPTPGVSASVMLQSLPSEAVEAFIAAAGPDSGSQTMVVELRQLGGALARPSAVPSALPGLAAQYILFTCSIVPMPELHELLSAGCEAIVKAMSEWAGGQYLNFAEAAGTDTSEAFSAEHYERLQTLRFAWDPDEALVASHRIPTKKPF